MARAQLIRFAIASAGGALSLLAFLALTPASIAIAAALALLALSALLAETAFRRMATADERRSDLEDRVRNPPL